MAVDRFYEIYTPEMSGKKGKHAMTPELMWQLKASLRKCGLKLSRRRIIWAVSTICWAGALRVHEMLARRTRSFDATSTMTVGDVKVTMAKVDGKKVVTLKIHLKHPKEERLSAGVTIDVFETGDFMCPIDAFKKWERDARVSLDKSKPLFRLVGGENYTGLVFNRDLRALLSGVVDYEKAPITAHSFRRGLATFMAKNGYSDAQIMRIGRWHSRAFENYIVTPREVRAKLAEELAEKVAKSMELS